MPEITNVYQNSPAFSDAEWESPWNFLGDVSAVKFTVYCSENANFSLRWAVDNKFEVITTDTYTVTGGTEESILVPITSRFCQFVVNNIASTPCDLKTQAFFFEDLMIAGPNSNNDLTLPGDKGPITALFFEDNDYSGNDYNSEWFPANTSTSFEFLCKVNKVARSGIEFSNDKVAVVKTVSDRVIPNFISKVVSNSYASWVRMFIRGIGAKIDGSITAGPYTIQAWGYYHKTNLIETNRVDELSIWGDVNTDMYLSSYVSTDKWDVLKMTALHESTDFEVTLEYSSGEGTITHSDSSGVISAGSSTFFKSKVKDRYVRIKAQTFATSTTSWNVSVFFFDFESTDLEDVVLSSAGGTSLVSDGVGEALKIKGLVAGSNITIVDNNTDLTINSTGSISTLASAGGTSIVTNGTGPNLEIQGFTAGAGIVLDNTTNPDVMLISASGAVSNVWQQASGLIRPISSNTQGLLTGNNNSISLSGSQNCTVVGGSSNRTLLNSRRCSILGGVSNRISGGTQSGGGARYATNCIVTGGTSNSIIGNDLSNNVITGGQSNSIERGVNNSVIAGNNNRVIDGNCGASSIIGGSNNQFRRNTFRSCILGGQNNRIFGGNASGGSNRNATDCVTIGGISNTITQARNANVGTNVIVGGSGHVCRANNNVVIGGNNVQWVFQGPDSSHSTTWTFSHGATFRPRGSNTFNVKNTGGSWFYSNNAATTGVRLAPGANSWSSVSDMNLKENIVEMDYSDVLSRLSNVPIYKYNFLGNNTEVKNIGVLAQDWNDISNFGCCLIQVPVMEPKMIPNTDENGDTVWVNSVDENDVVLLDENGQPILIPDMIQEVDEYGDQVMIHSVDENGGPIFETKQAKDPLFVDQMDVIGVSLSCVKALNEKNELLTNEVNNFNQRVTDLETHITTLQTEKDALEARVTSLETDNPELKTIAQRTKDKTLPALGGVFDGISFVV